MNHSIILYCINTYNYDVSIKAKKGRKKIYTEKISVGKGTYHPQWQTLSLECGIKSSSYLLGA